MNQNYPGISSYFLTGLFLITFLFSNFIGFGQNISKPTVTGVPVCLGSDIQVSFRATNGSANNANSGQLFTSSTQYQIEINNGTTTRILGTKPHGDSVVGQREFLDFNFSVQIPETDFYKPGVNYRIQIISTNPKVISDFSDVFFVKARPSSPLISNSGPVCQGRAIQLTAANIPNANYFWSGPNFSSNQQNPIIENMSIESAGEYILQISVDGCLSDPVSTIVEVYSPVTNNSIDHAQISCSSFTPNALSGSFPTGGDGNYNFLWESSTSGSNTGFSAAPGQNAESNYQPGLLSSTTWFRRKVTSANCVTNISNTIEITITDINKWSGAVNSNWNETSNWSCNTLPTLETNVIIPANLTSGNYPQVSPGNNALAKDLTIETGASVIVTDNWLRVAGDLLNFGVLNTETGSVSFEGLAAQTIPIAAFENNRILNLRIDNTTGVTSEAIIEVTGILNVENGNFNTGNELTLISDASQTALIDGSGNGQVIGLVTMQRYLDVAFGYKYFSTPFQNSVVGDFEPFLELSDAANSFPHVYRYEENRTLNDTAFATGWEAYNQADNALLVGEGYAFNFGATTNAKLVALTGEVNNGNYSRNLENNKGEFTKGFHLVGNPYPSPIDWDATEGWNKTNIEDGIYFFTAGETQYTGTYTSYVNGVSSTDGKSSNIIPSMQGFFVKVTDPAEDVSKLIGTLSVSNKTRVTDFDQEFLKIREQEEKPLLRLTAAYQGAANKDAMVIYFSPNSDPRFNKEMDAHKLMNTDASVPNLYSLSKEKIKLSIKALPLPESGKYEKIPLGIRSLQSGKMTINLSQVQNLPAGMNIYLIDSEKRIGQNLKNKSSYTFNIAQGENNSRFQLLFSEDNISDPAVAFNEKFSVDSKDFLKVKLNLEAGQKGELRVSTVTGQILEVKEGRGKEQVEFRSITSSGIYFINLYVNEQRYSKKVLVNN